MRNVTVRNATIKNAVLRNAHEGSHDGGRVYPCRVSMTPGRILILKVLNNSSITSTSGHADMLTSTMNYEKKTYKIQECLLQILKYCREISRTLDNSIEFASLAGLSHSTLYSSSYVALQTCRISPSEGSQFILQH